MSDPGQKLMTQVAVVNHLAVVSQLAQRSLKSDPVGPQILQQTFPPVRAFLDDFVEFCFGYAIAPARLNEHLTPDTTVAKSLGHSFSQFLTFAGSTLIDCDDRHGNYPPSSTLFSNIFSAAVLLVPSQAPGGRRPWLFCAAWSISSGVMST